MINVTVMIQKKSTPSSSEDDTLNSDYTSDSHGKWNGNNSTSNNGDEYVESNDNI